MRIFDDRKHIKERLKSLHRGKATAKIKFLRIWKRIVIKGRGRRTVL